MDFLFSFLKHFAILAGVLLVLIVGGLIFQSSVLFGLVFSVVVTAAFCALVDQFGR